MGIFLPLAFLFFIGSLAGWVLELVYRNLTRKDGKWINPGFCTGPYVPLYGVGLCILYLLASLEPYDLIKNPFWNKAVLFAAMAVGMTAVEYIAGVMCLQIAKVRLWDYSNLPGNIQGIICPQFSLIWSLFGAVYYFFIHEHILGALEWLAGNLAFSFVIGFFFGVFTLDVAHSANLVLKLKQYAKDHDVVVKYENIKAHMQAKQKKLLGKSYFFRPFRSNVPLSVYLSELYSDNKKARPAGKEHNAKTRRNKHE